MSTIKSELRPAVANPWRAAAIAAVDIVCIAGVIVLGLISHYGLVVLSEALPTLNVILPFLVGWAVCSLLAGAYDTEVVASAQSALPLTAVAWIAAANVGLILRSSPLFGGGSDWPFNLIITALVLLVLVPWRYVASQKVDTTRKFREP